MQKLSISMRLIAFFLLTGILINSCKNKSDQKITRASNEFTSYIQGFTSGVISNSDPIVIELAEEQKVEPGEKITEKIFDFKPEIKGNAVWKTKNIIEFQPDKKLPNGQIFEAHFYLSKLMDVPEKLKTFDFGFQTKTQAMDVQLLGMQPYDIKNLQWNKLEGVLTTADFAEETDIEKCVSAVQKTQEKNIRWVEHNYRQKTHRFVVDSIYRGEEKGSVIVQWNAKPIGGKDKDEQVIDIPSINNFDVMNVVVQNEPDQVVEVFFSDPVNPKQNLKGLIRFKDKTPLRYQINGNSVKIYPKNRIKKPTTLIISRNIRNSMGHKMKDEYVHKIVFRSLKPGIQTVSKGNILPNSNGLIFPFKAVNLKAVHVKIIKIFENNIHQFFQVNRYDGSRELARVGRVVYKKEVPLTSNQPIDYGTWNTFALDLSDLIQIEPGAIYRLEMSFDKNQSLYPCEKDSADNTMDNNAIDEDEKKYEGPTNDNEYYYYDDEYYYDDYDYHQRENPCSNSYYYGDRHKIRQNILASNFGIITKEDDNHKLNVFITDLVTTQNLPGVQVKIYDYQNQLIGESSTNAEGRAILALERKPFLLVAEKEGQYGYLRLDDGNSLSLSMFNVGGKKVQKGIKGYLFAERGVWRPGDSIYLNFILEDKQQQLPAHHPVVLEVYNPQNQLFLRKSNSRPVENFYDLRFATPAEAPTGNWTARVKVGGTQFTKILKIESIKPNRLKIILDFPDKILHSKDHSVKLQSKWLHGSPAAGLKAVVEMKLRAGSTHFKNYKDFVFDDASKDYYGETKTIFEGKLDENGEASIPLNIKADKAPGMLQANFKTRVFEKGGDFSIDRYSIMYSPYESYVGVKIPKGKGWNNALYSDEINLIPIVTIDEYGKPVDRKKLKIEVYEIKWRWWWQRDNTENLGYYLSSKSSNKILTDYIDTRNGQAIYKLKFPHDTWGRKFIKITDPVSGHSTGQIFYTDYKGWWDNPGNQAPGGAEMLTFNTAKKTYKVGEEVKINLPVSSQGKALISIENGSRVIDAFWTDVSKDKNQVQFSTTAEMAPNVYIHITYIQPHSQSENDRPIRLYGVQGITVENPDTHLTPVINMPDELRPEKEVRIRVSEKDGKPMTYSLFVVDEGLLDLTRFKTPNPWKHFYAREALGVKTYDMYNYVLGAFSGEIAGLLAIGGDEDLQTGGNKKANRFKPVVKFLGTFQLKKGQNRTHRFIMPNYIGSVRTMVVAGNSQGSYGKAEKTTPVKKPLMVLATMPRVLGPQEQLKLPVTVFAMDKKIKDVKIKILTNDLLQIKGNNTQNLHFDKEGEQMAYFDMEVARKTGTATVNVEVSGGGEKARYRMEIPVRIANPELTRIQKAVLSGQKSMDMNYTPVGITGTNKAVLEVSTIPPVNLEQRLEYLVQYPHGCIEQTTSSVFPQLYLDDLMQLSNTRKAEIQDNITAGLQRLKRFQLNNGGFTYWPGEGGHADDWGTNYAGHFIVEAQYKGYQLPVGMLKDWIAYQRNRANDWNPGNSSSYRSRSHQLLQAYRLYTLALAGKPALGAMNRLREINNLYPAAQWRLIAAYYLAGKKNIAREMMKNLTTGVDNYTELGYTYGNSDRDRAMILETLVLLKDYNQAKDLLDVVASRLSSNKWMSTQTTAFSLLAVSKFVAKQGNEPMQFQLQAPGIRQNYKTDKPVIQISLTFAPKGTSQVHLESNTGKTLFARLINSGIPLESDNLAFSQNLIMEVNYYDIDGHPIDESRIKQGTDFVIEVRLKHPGILDTYQNMALTQIFPSGWEITNARMDNIRRWSSDKFTYQDIRDDRIMTYFDLNKGGHKTFRIMANAAYVGDYYLPSIKAEAMYDNNIINITNGKWVKVVK